MLFLAILPIFSIIGVGLLINSLIKRISSKSFTYAEIIINSNVLGFSLLIFPLIFLGIQNYTSEFSLYMKIFAIIGLISSIYFLYRLIRFFFNCLEQIFHIVGNIEPIYILLVIIGISIYFIYSFLLPLRGYDSLWMYFPNSLIYFQTSSIPAINILNFMPTIKEPLNSLLYTFTLSITGEWAIELIPFYFILLWAFLTYQLAYLILKSRKLALISFLVFLFLPVNIWFMDNWPYYQDIFLGFFFTLTVYYVMKLQSEENSRLDIVLGGLSLALTLVAKLSGWTLFLILPMLLKVNKRLKMVLLIYMVILFSFLTFQGIFRIYIGILPIFLLFIGIIGMHFWFGNNQTVKKNNLRTLAPIFGIGIIIGGYWLLKSLERVSMLSNFLLDQYFNLSDLIKWNYVPPNEINWIFEHAHSISFESIILFLLVSNLFGLFLIIPKIRSIFHFGDTSPMIIWIIAFFSIWVVFHSTASFRYLTPIITPIVIIIIKGSFLLFESFNKRYNSGKSLEITESIPEMSYIVERFFTKKTVILIIFLEIITLYIPVIPSLETSGALDVNNIGLSYIKNAFFYYSNWFLILFLIFLIPLFTYFVMYNRIVPEEFFTKTIRFYYRKFNNKGILLFLLVIILIPTFLPIGVFIYNGANLSVFQESYVFENRKEYKEVVANIIAENNPRGGIISFNTPGLSIWTLQSVLDLFQQYNLVDSIFTNNSITRLLNFMKNPLDEFSSSEYQLDLSRNFSYVIIPNTDNYFYSLFLKNFRFRTYFFSILENPYYFEEIFFNNEFRLFRTKFSSTEYIGPYDVFLRNNKEIFSLFNEIKMDITNISRLEFEFPIDISLIKKLGINISLSMSYHFNEEIKIVTDNFFYNFVSNNFLRVSKDINYSKSFIIDGFKINMSYIDENFNLMEKNSVFYSEKGLTVEYINNTYNIVKGPGLKISYF